MQISMKSELSFKVNKNDFWIQTEFPIVNGIDNYSDHVNIKGIFNKLEYIVQKLNKKGEREWVRES
jgi:hypothetical protein